MEPNTQHDEQAWEKLYQERFEKLPTAVKNAITSADIEKRLRTLSEGHKLHIDQWELLEVEVKLSLLGFQPVEKLEENIQKEVGVSADEAHALTTDINAIVFEPIRQELERQLSHPEAHDKEISGVEAAREQALASAEPAAGREEPPAISTNTVVAADSSTPTPVPPPQPATPPAPLTDIKVTRPSESTAYRPGEASTERASVHDDPYREPPV